MIILIVIKKGFIVSLWIYHAQQWFYSRIHAWYCGRLILALIWETNNSWCLVMKTVTCCASTSTLPRFVSRTSVPLMLYPMSLAVFLVLSHNHCWSRSYCTSIYHTLWENYRPQNHKPPILITMNPHESLRPKLLKPSFSSGAPTRPSVSCQAPDISPGSYLNLLHTARAVPTEGESAPLIRSGYS